MILSMNIKETKRESFTDMGDCLSPEDLKILPVKREMGDTEPISDSTITQKGVVSKCNIIPGDYRREQDVSLESDIKCENVKMEEVTDLDEQWFDTCTIKCEQTDWYDQKPNVKEDSEIERCFVTEWRMEEPCSSGVVEMTDGLGSDNNTEEDFSCDCGDSHDTEEELVQHKTKCQLSENVELNGNQQNLKRQRKKTNSKKSSKKSFDSNARSVTRQREKSYSRLKDTSFSCVYCDFSSNRKCRLVKHMRIHDKEKKRLFSCANCNYSTNYQTQFNAHLSLHLKTRTEFLFCAKCNYKARSLEYLRNHTLSKHSEDNKNYSCVWCTKRFRYKVSIDDHIVKNHENFIDIVTSKIHNCAACNYKTTIKQNINFHMSKHHPNSKR